MKKAIKILSKQIRDLQIEKAKLEDILWEKENKSKIKKLIGKCFAYKNSYSCPVVESDYWNLYSRVLSYDKKEKSLVVESFQKIYDKYNKEDYEMFFYQESKSIDNFNNKDYKEISFDVYKSEYLKQIEDLKNRI